MEGKLSKFLLRTVLCVVTIVCCWIGLRLLMQPRMSADALESGRNDIVEKDMAVFKEACLSYCARTGEFPKSFDDLADLLDPPFPPHDPWNRVYEVTNEGDGVVTIYCASNGRKVTVTSRDLLDPSRVQAPQGPKDSSLPSH